MTTTLAVAATAFEATGIAAGRALLVAVLGVVMSAAVARLIGATSRRSIRRILWAASIAPLLTPSIVVGYSWANDALRLSQWTGATLGEVMPSDWLVAAVLAFKLMPIALLVRQFAPEPALTRQAWHCDRMLDATATGNRHRRSGMYHAVRYVSGPGRAGLLAGAVVFLFAYQEFEITSLLFANSWTVRLFDQQVGGTSILDTFGEAWPSAVIALLVLAPIAWAAAGLSAQSGGRSQAARQPCGGATRIVAGAWLTAALGVVLVRPMATIFDSVLRAPGLVPQVITSRDDIGAGVLFAIGAACVTLLIVRPLERPRRWHVLTTAVLCVPGLFGALVIALTMLRLLQLDSLSFFLGRAESLLFGLVLYLMPFAALLMLLVSSKRDSTSSHAAAMLGASSADAQRRAARSLNWSMRFEPLLAVVMLLFWWAFFDLTVSSILQPVEFGPTPIAVRLYNLLHYDRSDALATMVAATMLVPPLLWAVLTGVGRACVRWWPHG